MNKRMVMKRSILFIVIMLMVTAFIGCSNQNADLSKSDIVTQKKTDNDKIDVTVLVKYAFSANAFEKAVEERFPELNLIQVGNYTDNTSNELEQRMKNDDLTDMVFTWPQNVGEQYFEDCLMELSGMPYTGRYNISMLDKLSPDGALYYLPGPAQLRGILYNKTMFKEHGWEVPKDYEGFLALCKEIEATGIRPLQLSLQEPGVIETAFWGFGYNETLSRPQESQKLVDFNMQEESFGSFSQGAFASFQRLIDNGILKPEDLEVKFYQRTDRLFARECAMISDGASVTAIGKEWSGCEDEFAIMPFYSPGQPGDWGQLYLTCLIGLNKHLEEAENKEKYELVMKIMDYISSVEGQQALASDDGMISSLNNAPLPRLPEIADMQLTLEQSRYASFPILNNAQDALHEGLSQMLLGTMSSEDVIQLVDGQNVSSANKVSSPIIGTAEETFSLLETGSLVTDAMRERSGADVALFLDNGRDGKFNARGISAKIYEGDITEDDIRMRVLPVLQHNERGVLQTVEMKGKDIRNALEYTLDDGNWFYYFSGLHMTYAPMAKQGSRIMSITDDEGNQIDDLKVYKVAIMDGSVDEKYIQSVQDSQDSIYDVVSDAIKQAVTIAPVEDGRFQVSEP